MLGPTGQGVKMPLRRIMLHMLRGKVRCGNHVTQLRRKLANFLILTVRNLNWPLSCIFCNTDCCFCECENY